MAYTRRLAAPTSLGAPNTTVTLFTVPSGVVYVIRTLVIVVQVMVTNGPILFGINSTATATRLFRKVLPNDDTTMYNDMRWVFNAGENFVGLHGGSGGQVIVSAHGFVLGA